jgi:hypothetical protein
MPVADENDVPGRSIDEHRCDQRRAVHAHLFSDQTLSLDTVVGLKVVIVTYRDIQGLWMVIAGIGTATPSPSNHVAASRRTLAALPAKAMPKTGAVSFG